MIVRTLFLKIFLWFWLALILVVATVFLVVEPPRSERSRGGPGGGGVSMIENLTEFQLRGLASLYAAGDREAFERQRRGLEDAMNFSVFIVDASDTEVTGRTIGAEVIKFARQRAERGGLRNPRNSSDRTGERSTDRPMPRIYTAKVSLNDGRELLAFAPEGMRRFGGGGGGPPSAATILSNTDFLSWTTALRLGAIILVAGLVCWALARYLTAPMRRLQTASRDLESGELGVRVSPDLLERHDEIGELARDFDRMARRVSTVISTQRQLLRDVSHELRSPLARLHVAVELASEDAPQQAQHALDRVRREADRLEELIGQLLALARLESGAVEQERVDIDLATTLAAIVDDAKFEAAGRGRQVALVRCDPAATHGVPSLIRSAIDNVIRNAIDFTPEQGTVEISLTANADQTATIAVRDYGPGVAPEALTRIFEPFFRAVSSSSRPRSGTGLGLAITDRAVRLHRGTISASNAEGGGLLMQITLPMSR